MHGRRGELIITGGENVWPEPVERVLRGHPGVADVMVAGAPDAEWGYVVVAAVVPADPDCPPTLPELRAVVQDVPAGLLRSTPTRAGGGNPSLGARQAVAPSADELAGSLMTCASGARPGTARQRHRAAAHARPA